MDIATGRPRASRGVEEGGFVDRVPLDRLARTSFVVPEEPNVVRSPGLMYDHLVQRGGEMEMLRWQWWPFRADAGSLEGGGDISATNRDPGPHPWATGLPRGVWVPRPGGRSMTGHLALRPRDSRPGSEAHVVPAFISSKLLPLLPCSLLEHSFLVLGSSTA